MIKQMKLTTGLHELSSTERALKREEIVCVLDDTLKVILRSLPGRGLSTSSAENEAKMKWMVESSGDRPWETDSEK